MQIVFLGLNLYWNEYVRRSTPMDKTTRSAICSWTMSLLIIKEGEKIRNQQSRKALSQELKIEKEKYVSYTR